MTAWKTGDTVVYIHNITNKPITVTVVETGTYSSLVYYQVSDSEYEVPNETIMLPAEYEFAQATRGLFKL